MSWVVRDDFPRSRRGWDRNAVLDHLRDVESEMQSLASTSRMSGRAAEGVRRVVQAAEETLAELAIEAQRELEQAAVEAEAIRAAARGDSQAWLQDAGHVRAAGAEEAAAARSEAERIVAQAQQRARVIVAEGEAEAHERVAEAEAAIARLLADASALGQRVEAFGQELQRGFSRSAGNGPASADAVPRRRFAPGGAGGTIPPAPIAAAANGSAPGVPPETGSPIQAP
jgi:hypothetical protein